MYNACLITSELHYTTGSSKIQSFYNFLTKGILRMFLKGAWEPDVQKEENMHILKEKGKSYESLF